MNDFFSSISSGLSSVVSGIVSGLIASFVFYLYQKNKEREEKLVIDLSPNLKAVPKNILDFIRPGLSIEKMREILGVPNYIYDKEFKEDNLTTTNKYEYRFKNIYITTVSQDGKSIDSVDAFTRQYMDFNVEFSINPSDNKCRGVIGKSVIKSELLGEAPQIEMTSIDRQDLCEIITYHGRYGHFNHYSFFCASEIDQENKNLKGILMPDELNKRIIIGFRMSRN